MRNVRMALAALTGVALSVGGFASAAQADPLGNNGTVKIDAEAFDSHPDNQPHVGCLFQVDFYGFDQGDLNADVEFAVHPPTGTDVVLLNDTVFIGQDPAGGGTDLDAEKTYDLSVGLESLVPQEQQGFHVKLTINADGAQGGSVKHKVFWVQRCETNPT